MNQLLPFALDVTQKKLGGVSVTLSRRDYKDPILAFYKGIEPMDEYEYIVRRLTPTECARLQGMPDSWCDLVPHSDSKEYKVWGNGMALPCVLYVMEGIKNLIEEENTG